MGHLLGTSFMGALQGPFLGTSWPDMRPSNLRRLLSPANPIGTRASNHVVGHSKSSSNWDRSPAYGRGGFTAIQTTGGRLASRPPEKVCLVAHSLTALSPRNRKELRLTSTCGRRGFTGPPPDRVASQAVSPSKGVSSSTLLRPSAVKGARGSELLQP